jgi:hypothetical protein
MAAADNIISFGVAGLTLDCSGITWVYCKDHTGADVSTAGCSLVVLGAGDYFLTNPNATGPTAMRGYVTADPTKVGRCVIDPTPVSTKEAIIAGVAALLAGSIVPSAMQSRGLAKGAVPREIRRGDVHTITFTLGAEYDLTGKKVYVCAKRHKSDDNALAIVNREATVTDVAGRTGYITLTAVETANVGTYSAEIELRDAADNNPETAYAEDWVITQDVRQ